MNDRQVSDPSIKEIAPKEYVDHKDLDALIDSVGMTYSTEVASWWEPPDAGYRDYYKHEHESLIFTILKSAD